MSRIALATRVQNQKPSIWVTINKLLQNYQVINLGQGFPECLPPAHLLANLSALASPSVNPLLHQYTRSMGHPRLVKVLSKLYTPFLRCDPHRYATADTVLQRDSFAPTREIDPMNEIIVSVGAYGSLFAAISCLINPGDEVIIMDPSFDCYTPMTLGAGGVPVYVALRPTPDARTSNDWKLDLKELESKVTRKTKMIILNTPHNPLGKVFTQEELEMVADLCIRHNLVCVSDEVYEWLVFPPNKHIKIASLPGMWSRTLTIGSAGKTFSVTGWKLGWTVGPEKFIHGMQLHQQNTVYTCPTPTQEAVARSLEEETTLLSTGKSYFHEMCDIIEPKGKTMVKRVNQIGMRALQPMGGYFLVADVALWPIPKDQLENDPALTYDVVVNNWLIKHKGVATIPMSVFYSDGNKHLGSTYLRFCFFKEDSTLEKAYKALEQ
ncbi:hypothetical protein CRM22_008019 [Opisthorchis felineus]|uniref:Aminotransferase class I/classII large domain-containing protein n=2 Tax=Opisthorchis felineus TaxID=147828 RepID=A0A4S2LF85_OPIFE|nr:hypothetical protein CRM22_008019 [Opisthorchis felineus]TGZ61377.1 hypothetical protein CRM22_008019 [Opisthorchis felineus]